MNISYDYKTMILELKEEISSKNLSITDNIQILRDKNTLVGDYRPILDWYYDDSIMIDIFKIDILDTQQDIDLIMRNKKKYDDDKPFLESISVANCLIEMKEWSTIFN